MKRERIRKFAFFMSILMLFTSIDFTSFAAEISAEDESVVTESQIEDESMDEAAAVMDNEEENEAALTEDILPESEWSAEGTPALNDVTETDIAEKEEVTETDITEIAISEEETIVTTDYGLTNPRKDANGNTVWDCVWFGNYWQEDTNGDGTADNCDMPKPVKWRVLSVDGDKALLLADKNLDCQQYNTEWVDVTWETCTMRSWLNGYGADSNVQAISYTNDSFIGTAFTTAEKNAIAETTLVNADNADYGTEGGNDTTDRVFLLSLDDIVNTSYGFNSDRTVSDTARRAANTAFAESQGAYTASEEYAGDGWWWLRSPGHSSVRAAEVNNDGYVGYLGSHVDYRRSAVRPALYLNLSSTTVWSKAGTVTADGSVEETVPGDNPAPKTDTAKDYGFVEIPIKCDGNDAKLEVKWDEPEFSTSSKTYNHDMARMAMGLSTIVYGDSTEEIIKAFNKLGFDSISDKESDINKNEYYNYFPDKTNEEPELGSYSPCWIIHKNLILDGEETTIIVVAIRGTSGTEWIDNFRPGTGNTHKGFFCAAIRVYSELQGYIKKNNLTDKNAKLLITGHSRGAAASNILGKLVSDDVSKMGISNMTDDDVFVYTFATPNVTKDASFKFENGKWYYKNIFNIVNPEDFVTKVMLTKWGYRRYGETYVLPSKSTDCADFYEPYEQSVRTKTEEYGCLPYKSYKDGTNVVLNYIDSLYSAASSVDEFYNKNQYLFCKNGEIRTVQSLFVQFLGYFMSGQKNLECISYFTILEALDGKWDLIGQTTVKFFVTHATDLPLANKDFHCAHFWSTYLAAMNYISKEDLLKNRNMILGRVNCPVDVTIKNQEGELIGSIINNEIQSVSENEIFLSVEGDSKVFSIPSGEDYMVELTGNNNGTMDYSLSVINPDTGEMERIVYEAVPVVKDESYSQIINVSDNLAELDLLDISGEIVEVSQHIEESELDSISANVAVEGIGTVNGAGYVTPGDYVILSALTDENNEFLGWYDNSGNLISEETTYEYSAMNSRDFIAKFTNNVVDAESISVSESIVYMEVADYYYNNVTMTPSNATYKMYTYESSNPEVVSANEMGVMIALKEGESIITVTSVDGKASTTYKIIVGDIEINSVVILDPNGGKLTASVNGVTVSANGLGYKNVSENGVYGELPEAEKEGHAFEGWFTDPVSGNKITAETKVTLSENLILYAHWKLLQYQVTFDANGGKIGESDKSITVSSDGLTAVKTVVSNTVYGALPAVSREHYEFLGWFTTKDETKDSAAVSENALFTESEDKTLYAHWKQKIYTLTFDGCGGNLIAADTSIRLSEDGLMATKTVASGQEYGSFAAAEKEGFLFAGWYTKPEGGEAVDEKAILTKDITIYAQWNYITLVEKQKIDVKSFFEKEIEHYLGVDTKKKQYKYAVKKVSEIAGNKGSASVSAKTGILTAKRSGVVEIRLMTKNIETKKWETSDKYLTVVIEKPAVKKAAMTYVGQQISVDEFLSYQGKEYYGYEPNYCDISYEIAKPKAGKPKIASVDAKGNLTALSTGTTKLTITYTNNYGAQKPSIVKKTVSVSVKIPKFSKETLIVAAGKKGSNALKNVTSKTQTVTYSVDKPWAEIDAKGKVKVLPEAVSGETATVTATVKESSGKEHTYSYLLKVK